MFYDCAPNDHGLPHNPLKQCVVPRPIGWVSTDRRQGHGSTLAPFSFYNLVSENPPLVIYCPGRRACRRAARRIRCARSARCGEFVVNVATFSLREALNVSSAPAGSNVDEFELAGLPKEPSRLVRPPRVKDRRCIWSVAWSM